MIRCVVLQSTEQNSFIDTGIRLAHVSLLEASFLKEVTAAVISYLLFWRCLHALSHPGVAAYRLLLHLLSEALMRCIVFGKII